MLAGNHMSRMRARGSILNFGGLVTFFNQPGFITGWLNFLTGNFYNRGSFFNRPVQFLTGWLNFLVKWKELLRPDITTGINFN